MVAGGAIRYCIPRKSSALSRKSFNPVCHQIARQAQLLGFPGIAGFDMLVVRDGAVKVIDLNFRPNASAGHLLAFDGAVERSGRQLARSVYLRSRSSLETVLPRFLSFTRNGVFDP